MRFSVVTVTDPYAHTHKISVLSDPASAGVCFDDWCEAYPTEQVRLYRDLPVAAESIEAARAKITSRSYQLFGFPPPDREQPALAGDRRYISTVIDLSDEQFEALRAFGIDVSERSELIVRRLPDGAVEVVEVTDVGVVKRTIDRDGTAVERRRPFASGGWVEIESVPIPASAADAVAA